MSTALAQSTYEPYAINTYAGTAGTPGVLFFSVAAVPAETIIFSSAAFELAPAQSQWPETSFVANGSNSLGVMVGYYIPVFRRQAATLANGVLTDYGPQVNAALGTPDSYGNSINDSGHFVGNAQATAIIYGFRYAYDSVVSVGKLSQDTGGQYTVANGTNNFDQVVGSSRITGSSNHHAFLWEHGVIHDMNDSIDPTSGIILISANSITDGGTITCSGTLNGMNQTFVITPPTPPAVVSMVSRKTHSGAGALDISLPTAGVPGIECRGGGAPGSQQIVITFQAPVTLTSAAVTSGTGSVMNVMSSGNQLFVNLANVANAQTITVALFGVSDGTSNGDVRVRMATLLGDSNSDGFVNAGDALQTRSRSGQITDVTNFRSDVNVDGFVNGGDTFIVRSRSGTFLP